MTSGPHKQPLQALVIWDGSGEGYKARVPIYSWKDFMALGKDVPDSAVRARIDGACWGFGVIAYCTVDGLFES